MLGNLVFSDFRLIIVEFCKNVLAHILKYNLYSLPRLAVLLIELATSLPDYFHCQWRRRGNKWFLFDCADRNDNLEDTLHLLDPVPLDGIEQFRQKLLLTISGPDDT